MRKRLTITEARWPDTPEYMTVAATWQEGAISRMLGLIWQGYEILYTDVLANIDVQSADEQLERSLTQNLTPSIRQCMTGEEFYDIEQGVYENETALPSPAQPPLYDLAFVLKQNRRIMWPLEAKVLRTDGNVSAYVDEIHGNFLTCRYAPFSTEGAILGYLLKGDPGVAFKNISSKVPCTLDSLPHFHSRDHRTSSHKRSVPAGKPYPVDFVCHHLILQLIKPDA